MKEIKSRKNIERCKEVKIHQILRDSTCDGDGLRTVIFISGCPWHCPNCWSPETWSVDNGKEITLDKIIELSTQTKNNNITLSGGDPLSFQFEDTLKLAQVLKEEHSKNIWCYTGFLWENIEKSKRLSKILPYLDVIVDGQFKIESRDIGLKFRGSSNQRIINVQASLEANRIVLL